MLFCPNQDQAERLPRWRLPRLANQGQQSRAERSPFGLTTSTRPGNRVARIQNDCGAKCFINGSGLEWRSSMVTRSCDDVLQAYSTSAKTTSPSPLRSHVLLGWEST